MKRRTTLSLVLTLSVLLPLVSLPSTAQAAPPQRFRFSSGVVNHGIDQTLRVTVVGGSATIRVRIKWMKYMAVGCSSSTPPVCRHTVESQGAAEPETLVPGEAISINVDGGAPVNIVVESNSRDARVAFQLIKTSTGEVVAILLTDDLFNG